VLTTCNKKTPVAFNPDKFQPVEMKSEEVVFTYDVKWERSELTWSQRWDVYLKGNPDDEIHYFSIVNSLMIVLFLTGVVAMIMLRTLHKDISSYNEMQTLEEAQEESGWKLVHGDVFRPPSFSPMLLSVLAGSGMQILAMTLATMVCALLGLTSPDNRGGLVTTLLMLYVFMGSFAGYGSARIYKLFNGKEWKRNTFLTATLFPGVMGCIFLFINFFVASYGSSTAAPITTLLALMLLWIGVSTPLVFVGSYFGFRKDTIEVPVRTNQIARHIPDQVWYTHPAFSIALGGILPFGAVCIELYFIMSAIWLHQLYFVFGFLFVVLIILIATCAEITIVMCYFQLCNEDYQWWWRSYLSAGSSGLYLFLYSVWYFVTKLNIEGIVPTVLYFAYMAMICITFFMLTGSIGFFACLWFVRKIYGAIKVD
jgi:transmembrane 9 superfamily protein 2/4